MKTIKVDIVTEIKDIQDIRAGAPQSFIKLTPLMAQQLDEGSVPMMTKGEVVNYYPHRVYRHDKTIETYLVRHSDKGIFEDLIQLSSDDIANFRQEIKDKFFEENKPTEEFLEHYYRDAITSAKEKWERNTRQSNRKYQDQLFKATIFKADALRQFIAILLVFILIGIVANFTR